MGDQDDRQNTLLNRRFFGTHKNRSIHCGPTGSAYAAKFSLLYTRVRARIIY